MKNLTLWGAAFLGVFIFSMTMLSQAMSNTAQTAMVRDPIGQNIAETVGPSDNFTGNVPGGGADAGLGPANNILSGLLRIGERRYKVEIDPSVSRKVLNQYRVRKFGFGRLENVQILTTASGTYSSDALKSEHIVYPGINVSEIRPFQVSKTFILMVWNAPDGWKALESSSAPSFLSME